MRDILQALKSCYTCSLPVGVIIMSCRSQSRNGHSIVVIVTIMVTVTVIHWCLKNLMDFQLVQVNGGVVLDTF